MSNLSKPDNMPSAITIRGREYFLIAKTHWAEYTQKPLLNIGFIISLAIATSTLLSILILNDASKQQYQQANTRLKSPVVFHVVDKQNKLISRQDFSRLRQLGFHQLNGVHIVKKPLATGQDITLYGLDILPIALSNPQQYRVNKLNISKQYIAKLGLESTAGKLPNQLAFSSINPQGSQAKSTFNRHLQLPLNINEINDWGNVALLDITLLWQLFPDTVGFTHLSSSAMSAQQQSHLALSLPEHLTIQALWSLEEREGFADALHLNLSALAILGFIVSLFIAYQAAAQAWRKRSELAAKLRLLGVELSIIKRVLIAESILLTLIAGMIGLGIAIALVTALLPVLGLTLDQLYQLRMTGHFTWQWHYILWALLLSGSAVFIALIKQFNVISQAEIALNAKNQNVSFNYKFSFLVAMGLMCIFIVWPNIGLWHEWHQLMLKYGVLLLASVAFLPVILKSVLMMLSKIVQDFRLRFVFKDASEQVGRRYLPLAAFYLALTASISAALMVHSFESAFVGYLNQLLNSDAFVSYNAPQKEKIRQWIKRQDYIEGYAPYEQTSAQYKKDGALEKVSIYGLATRRQSQGLLFKVGGLYNIDTDRHEDQLSACYINEQFAFKHSIELQQQILLEQGVSLLYCRVEGIYYDYGNHGLAVKMPIDYAHLYLSHWNETGFGLYLKKDLAFNKQQIIDELDLQEDQVFIPEQIKALALDIFKQTFVLTQAIAFVLLAIACFGLFLSANGLELARKSELYVLSSLGYSKNELLRHMLSQWFVLAGGAILLSWPVAVVIADALVSQILPASFGWSMPLSLEILPFAASSLLALVILLPALVLPLYKLNVRAYVS